MAAAQNMTQNAEMIAKASSDIAGQVKTVSEMIQSEILRSSETITNAEAASCQLAVRIENLNDSLRRMQLAVDVLTAELNGTQNVELEDAQ